MNDALNPKEKKLAELISKSNGNSVWVITAKKVIGEGFNWQVRRLFADLKSQRSDNPYLMRQIIGQEANELLATI